MPPTIAQRIKLQLFNGLDLLLVTLSYGICWMAYYKIHLLRPFFDVGNYVMVILFAVFYYILSHLYNGYVLYRSRIYELVYSQALAAFISDGLLYVITVLVNRHLITIVPVFLAFLLQIFMIVLWCVGVHRWFFHTMPPLRTVVILGQGQNAAQLLKEYGFHEHFHVQDVVDSLECLRDVPGHLQNAQAVYCCGLRSHNRNIILKYCVAHNIITYVIPRIGDVIMNSARKIHPFHIPMMEVTRYAPSPEYLFTKRLLDIVLSLIAVVCFSPFMLVTAIAIKLTDGGDIFYRQKRLTQNGRVFDVLKFRSMRMDAEKDGVARLSTGDKDPRITKVGRIIRACRVDEMPQLLNILKGDMAIVGPRPERPEISEQYAAQLPEWNLRLQAKCGLTGYAQVYGQYNTTPYDKLLFDLMYIAHPNLFEDFKIIFATVKILFMKESTAGVAEGQVTAGK